MILGHNMPKWQLSMQENDTQRWLMSLHAGHETAMKLIK